MKLVKHFIWIGVIFLVACGLFYFLFVQGFLTNKWWNENANATKCVVANTNIVNVDCSIGRSWGNQEHQPRPRVDAQEQPKCYDGMAIIRYVNASQSFDVAYGSYDEVNQTLIQFYPVGGCVDCLVQRSNASDFRLGPKSEAYPLAIAILVPGAITLILIAWGVCVFFAKRDSHYVQY